MNALRSIAIAIALITTQLTTITSADNSTDTTQLVELQQVAINLQSTPQGLEAARRLLREAKRLNNTEYQSYAQLYTALYYYNNGIRDSVPIYTAEALKLSEREGPWKVYFTTSKMVISMHIINEDYEYSIDEAWKMYHKANDIHYLEGKISAVICLVYANNFTGRIKESVDILQRTYKETTADTSLPEMIELLSLLSLTMLNTEQYEEMRTYLEELHGLLDQHIKNVSFQPVFNSIYLLEHILYAFYELHYERPQKALEHFRKADELQQIAVSIYKEIYYDAYAEYYRQIRDYNNALKYIKLAIENLSASGPKNYYRLLIKKANILNSAGRTSEALKCYQESLFGIDSLDHAMSVKQMEHIQKSYNDHQVFLDQERLKVNQSSSVLIIVVCVTLMITILIFRSLSIRGRLKESERQMRIAKRIAEENNEVKNLFLSNMSYNIRTPLNNVVGFSQLIALDPDMDATQRKEYTDIIKQNTESLLNLVNDVLDLSRLEAGMMKFTLETYDIGTLCREAVYVARTKLPDNVHINLQEEVSHLQIRTDLFRFNDLLLSLLACPNPSGDETKIDLNIRLDRTGKSVHIRCTGSPIANLRNATQEATIRNDINRLFLKRFGGTYIIRPGAKDGAVVELTYPIFS